MVEKQTKLQIKTLRSDGGAEYFSNEFSDFLQKHGIRRQFTCRNTPQQNGVAKRMNRMINERVLSMLSNVGLTQGFWM